MMETAALLPRGRAKPMHLLGRVLYKHELYEMDSFHRCSLPMCADYNSQLSIHIFLRTNSKYHVSFLFSYLCYFSVVTTPIETTRPLWRELSFLKF